MRRVALTSESVSHSQIDLFDVGSQELSAPQSWLDKHGDYLYRYALLRLANTDVAEDVVQETLLAALQSRHRFAGKSSERTWLIGILKHKLLDHFRKVGREIPAEETRLACEEEKLFQTEHESSGHWHGPNAPADWRQCPQSSLETAEFRKVLHECLTELPPRLASAFALREMEERSSPEICDILGVTDKNLWVMLYRARMHLRRCLERRWFSPEVNIGQEVVKPVF